MKLVFFDYVFEPDKPGITGLSDLVWVWAKNLIAMGHEVHIVAPYPNGAQPPEGTIVHRYDLPPLGHRNVLGHILVALKGWREIRKIDGADIIQAPEYLSTGIFALLSRRTPVVLKVPGNIYERIAHGNPFDWSVTQVLKVMARLSARFCAAVIVTSEEMRWWWGRTGTPPENMVLIPDGVDVDRFHPMPDARERLGWTDGQRPVLYVGRLSHEKGVQHLMEALPAVRDHVPGVRLHLLGEGPHKRQLQELIGRLGLEEQVVFHGWVDQPQLPLYYSGAEVTVLPSFSEGLPRVMMEALACGSVFLGTRITGIIDHIEDEKTGYLVEPGDPEGLAARLVDILTNPSAAARVARQGYAYVSEHLSAQHAARLMYERVFLPLTQGKPIYQADPVA